MTDHDKTAHERECFEAHLSIYRCDLSVEPDAWGRPRYVHSHIEAMWFAWQARAALEDQAATRKALSDLLQYVERRECTHEETFRGGTIWTICSGCGAKLADDQGGFKLYVEPAEITAARKVLYAADTYEQQSVSNKADCISPVSANAGGTESPDPGARARSPASDGNSRVDPVVREPRGCPTPGACSYPPGSVRSGSADPVAWQWRAVEDGKARTPWYPDFALGISVWEEYARGSDGRCVIERRPLYAAPPDDFERGAEGMRKTFLSASRLALLASGLDNHASIISDDAITAAIRDLSLPKKET